jgi:hypothetical protein
MADLDLESLAAKFGAIIAPQVNVTPTNVPAMNTPWSGMPPKEVNDMRQKVYDQSQKRIQSIRDAAYQAENVLTDLNRFGELNRATGTGSLYDAILTETPQLHGAAHNEMTAIQSRLGPAQRIQGSGSSSDRDVKLFMTGLPSVNQKGDVNKNIRVDFEKKYNYAVGKATFLEDYLNQYGHLNGADREWGKYKDQYINQPTESRPVSDKTSVQPSMTMPKVKFLGFEPPQGQ